MEVGGSGGARAAHVIDPKLSLRCSPHLKFKDSIVSSHSTMGSFGKAQRSAIILSKHAARDKALALASPYDASIHDPFLRATGRNVHPFFVV